MRASKECRPAPEIFLADPGVGGFDLFGFSQVNEYHEVKKMVKVFLNRLIIPFHPQDLLFFWKDEISQIIDRQQEALSGRIVKGLCSVADIGGMKFGKLIPMERVDCLFWVRLLFHSFLTLQTEIIIIESYSIFNGKVAKLK
jgi:hypothetical protein